MALPTLQQLRYFTIVAEELHFGRAAERIGIAQPPLTQQIQKLEGLLGCPLLVRGRKNQLTAAGVSLATDAKRILMQTEAACELTRRTARGEAGQLRLGVPPSVMLTVLPKLVRRYRMTYPEVEFTLREMATSRIEEALWAREIDLGFLREARPEAPLQSSLFLTEKLTAVLPAKHPLAERGALALKDLHGEPFVFFPAKLGPAFHSLIVEACVTAGFSPRIVQEATQWQTVVSFVEAGMGVSIAPACVARFRCPGVVFRTLAAPRTSVWASWYIENASVAALRFVELARAR